MNLFWIRILFLVAAIYDFALGSAFIFAGPKMFDQFGVTHPSHWGYIHFCCLMLMIFGLMFLAIAVNPRANRNMILFGLLLKASYVGAVGYYWVNGGIPFVFKPFVVIDAVMFGLFAWAFVSLRSSPDGSGKDS